MDQHKKDEALSAPELDLPGLAQQDWDDIATGETLPETVPENGDIRYDEDDPTGDLTEEDDDNPDQESDEALPDDLEEAVLRRDPSKEGHRFDEV